VVGNLAAIAQTNLKRMLAYSDHRADGLHAAGLMAGVVSGNTLSAANAYSSALFYMVTYVLTTLGTFGIIMLLSRQGFESEEIADLAGLNQRSPWMAGVMAMFMFSLAGIPPTGGLLRQAVGAAGADHHQRARPSTYLALAVCGRAIAVLLSLMGAFYYLRVVKVMYFRRAGNV
jgi:NADH-quinone oxidoreductase subunit N